MHSAGATLREFRTRLQKALSLTNAPIQTPLETDDIVRTILDTVLAAPLVFDGEELPKDTLWWFRGTASLPIEALRWTGAKSCELGFMEMGEALDIEYILVSLDYERPDLDFVYLNAHPMNLFIAPKESCLNNTVHPAGTALQAICEGLQTGKLPMETAIERFLLLPQSAYFQKRLGMS